MQRLLLLLSHTTYKARAFLDAAARLDVPVTVGTDRRQVLSTLDPAGNLTLDFARPEAAARDVAAFACHDPVTAVVAADDEGALVAAHAAAALGLRHHPVEGVRTARDKYRTRETLRATGLRVPPFWKFRLDADPRDVARRVVYPCVLKPLALSASRGVMRADSPEEFVAAQRRLAAILLDRRALAGEFMVEGFIPGFEVAVEGVVEDGAFRVLALFDKPDPLDGPFFEETIYVTPSRHPEDVQRAIVDMAQRGVCALGLRHGPVHAELRCNGAGAWVLEIAPRSIGGLCARALRFGDGSVSLEELLLRQALGRPTAGLEREAAASGVMMVPIPQAGVLRGVRGTGAAAAVAGIDAVQITIPPGQRIAPPPEGSRYLGFVFARGASAGEVEAALRAAHARLEIDIEIDIDTSDAAPAGGDAAAADRAGEGPTGRCIPARPAATRGESDAPVHR